MKKNQKKAPKLRKGAWFYRVRGSYLPATWQGWATYVPFVAVLLGGWAYALRSEETVAETLLLVFAVWIAAAVAMTWVAARKA
jgi:hypothetical protein